MHRLRNLLVLLAALMLSQAVHAAALFGTVDAISGDATLADPSGKPGALSQGQKVYEGQTINTASNGEVHLVTEDGGVIAVRPDTVFRVDGYKAEGGTDDKIFMSLFKGAIRSITGWIGKHNNSAYLITTPSATIGVRGTDHETTVIEKSDGDAAGTYDTVNEGSTLVKTPHGETAVSPGKFAFAQRGKATAPVFLAQHPNFWARRRLKIEERIQQRKEYFRNHMEQMRDQHIQRLKAVRGTGLNQAHAAREQEHRPLAARNNEFRNNRPEQVRQRREARRKEIERKRNKSRRAEGEK